MDLKSGAQLGPYEILSQLGAGGMGQVWKARDTRLDRIVAIKTSHARFSERFEREARAVAALNHPNICTLYDVGPDYLVMEYVEGAEIKGPLPLDQVLAYAIQLASALEAAHRKLITHRDLKPANILVTKAGVKVLDFGLAKFERANAAAASDETVTRALTQEGSIVGTLQYMAPEQLQGKAIDTRADIFSFGCVLYEMLTGKRAFDGTNTPSVIAAILERPAPSVSEVAPAGLDRAMRTCLAKDPDERWQSAGDLRRDLEWIAMGSGTEVPRQAEARPAWWIGAAGVVTLLLAGLAFVHFREKQPQPAPLLRATILPPPKTALRYVSLDSAPPAISPDGRRLVFGAASEDGRSQLYLRPLDSAAAVPLAGTENASYPFWSPDGRWIGFGAGGKLEKIGADGGPAIAIGDAPTFRGGSWSGNDEIVFAASVGGQLRKVAAAGGSATSVTTLANAPGGRWPWFLPDGRHFLYSSWHPGSGVHEIRIGSTDSGEHGAAPSKPLETTDSQTVYSEGYLLFTRERTLMAQPFDAARLVTTGEAMPMAEEIVPIPNSLRSVFAVSSGGILVYQGVASGGMRLTWLDRTGARTGAEDDAGDLYKINLSPDGKLAAVSASVASNLDIWIYDLERGLRSRFTFDPAAEPDAVWSPDGATIVFSSNRKGHYDLYRKAVRGAGEESLLYGDATNKIPTSWSPDGKYLLYDVVSARGFDLYTLRLVGPGESGGGKPAPFGKAGFNELNGQFSPDGKWVAYQSDESGRYEIYVTPFPGPGGRKQISASGGVLPRWRGDGRELFFITRGELMSAEIAATGGDVSAGAIRPLFGGLLAGSGYQYDVTADGKRFLAVAPPEQSGPGEPLTLVQNWMAGLKK